MNEHIKGPARFFAFVPGGLFAVGVAAQWTWLVAMLGLPLLAIVALTGTLAYTIRGLLALRGDGTGRQRVVGVVAAPAMLLLSAAAFWPVMGAAFYTGTGGRLALNRDHYDSIVDKARRGDASLSRRSSGLYEDGGVIYDLDLGPPVRIAFNPDGLLDNWSAIVFDPSGIVMRADGFDRTGKFAAPDEVTKLFGGDLVACRALWGGYYHCSFT